MGLKATKSFEGKGKGFHSHTHEHSINAIEGWDTRYKNEFKKPLSKKDAKLIHGSRSTKAQAVDNSKRANSILKPGTYRANAYLKNPNRHDIQGVDTISTKEKRWVYGTRDNKWHLVDKTDRDFNQGITQQRMEKIGKGKAKKEYLQPTLIKKEKIPTKKDAITGGLADNKPYSKYDPKQLEMGIKVEMEHTNDPKIAKEIASDHLEEIPDYYTRLAEMEEHAEKELAKKQPKTRVTYKVQIEDWEFYYDSEYLANKEAKRLERIHNAKSKITKTRSPTYKLGDMWKDDFDYKGMLRNGLSVNTNTNKEDLNKLFDSYEYVNYHTPNKHLWEAINSKTTKEKEKHLEHFRLASQKKLNEISQDDKSPSQLDFETDGTHSKREVEQIFIEEAKKVWRNDALIDDIEFDVQFYENGKFELAKIGHAASAGKPRAIDDTLVSTAKHHHLHINISAMELSESDFRKLMQHESLHLGYAGHTKEFRQIANKKDIPVSENQLFKKEVYVQAKTKDQYRYKTIKTMKTEDEARKWLTENRPDLTKKGYTKVRLQI